jgi:hypothetical protein
MPARYAGPECDRRFVYLSLAWHPLCIGEDCYALFFDSPRFDQHQIDFAPHAASARLV